MCEKTIRRIPDDVFDSSKFIERQLSSSGGHPTKLLTMDDSIEFIMVLPGQTAKQYRKQFIGIIKRYFGGDQSLHVEIDANAMSNSPIAQMARESLGTQPADDQELVGYKRRREKLELLKMEEEIKGMTQARILGLRNELEQLSDSSSSKLDEPTRLMFKDTLYNLLIHDKAASSREKQAKAAKPPLATQMDMVRRFLYMIATNTPTCTATKFKGRELYKTYTDYHFVKTGSVDNLMTETIFCREVKDLAGVCKKNMMYTLDHTVIKQSFRGC